MDSKAEPPPRASSKKDQRGMSTMAMRELRRARKLFKDGEPTPEAQFVVASANVIALLDLASAIREHGSNGIASEPEVEDE